MIHPVSPRRRRTRQPRPLATTLGTNAIILTFKLHFAFGLKMDDHYTRLFTVSCSHFGEIVIYFITATLKI